MMPVFVTAAAMAIAIASMGVSGFRVHTLEYAYAENRDQKLATWKRRFAASCFASLLTIVLLWYFVYTMPPQA